MPQSYEAENELRSLMAAQLNIVTPQQSKPVIGINQDSLVAAYLMSRKQFALTKNQFFDLTLKGEKVGGEPLWDEKRVETIKKIWAEHKVKNAGGIYCGRGLISLFLPEDLNYQKKNDIMPDEPEVIIRKGVYISGALDKSILGAAHGSLIQVLNKEYKTEVVSNFIDNMQLIGGAWLLIHGFSVGMEDAVSGVNCANDVDTIVKDTLAQCYAKAQGITETTKNPGIREIRVTAALSQARDVGMKVAKEAMRPDNNFLVTVLSGSKGDFFNIAQLTAMLGQQNIEGGRIQPCMSHGKRTMPHFHTSGVSQEDMYQSMGFVTSSFKKGLSPVEYFCHAKSAREGVIDTSLNTAKSGYVQRRIVKTSEDIVISHEQMVADTNGRIFQFTYGENQLDSTKTIQVDGVPQVCNVAHIADRLNTRVEMGLPDLTEEPEPEVEFLEEKENVFMTREEEEEGDEEEGDEEEGDEEEGEGDEEQEEGDEEQEEGEEEGDEEAEVQFSEDEDFPDEEYVPEEDIYGAIDE